MSYIMILYRKGLSNLSQQSSSEDVGCGVCSSDVSKVGSGGRYLDMTLHGACRKLYSICISVRNSAAVWASLEGVLARSTFVL